MKFRTKKVDTLARQVDETLIVSPDHSLKGLRCHTVEINYEELRLILNDKNVALDILCCMYQKSLPIEIS